jgi:hypothetical protein
MNAKQQNFLDKMLKEIEESKEFYIRIMGGENDAAQLIKWMIDNDINSYEVFPDYIAGNFYHLDGFSSLYSILTHALYDDGDIEFLKITQICEGYRHSIWPKVVFYWRGESNFESYVKEILKLREKDLDGADISYEFEFMSNVQGYIKEYEKKEKEYAYLCEQNDRWMKQNNKQLDN